MMRDRAGSVIICSIENFDAMSVHTGIDHGPDPDPHRPRVPEDSDWACVMMTAVGVETGSNVQFGWIAHRRMLAIEMNPSRAAALASKATGFPSLRSPLCWLWDTRDEI